MNRSCCPPPRTRPGTFHWMRQERAAEPTVWLGREGWQRFGDAEFRSVAELQGWGWRYIGPCVLPEREDG